MYFLKKYAGQLLAFSVFLIATYFILIFMPGLELGDSIILLSLPATGGLGARLMPKARERAEAPNSRRAMKTSKASPGWRLRNLAETVFSRKTYELVFEPTLENLSSEYYETLKEGRLWKARFVCLRGYWSFWAAALAQMPVSAFKVVSQIWKAIP